MRWYSQATTLVSDKSRRPRISTSQGEAVSTRVGEADQEITDRLGMNADQFFQVILLPQGEFARFLRAPSDQRVELLEKLFGTDRFRDVEQWLAERRRLVPEGAPALFSLRAARPG